MHAALGVDLAAEGAGAALHAAAGVTGDRAAAGADRGRSLHRQLAVAAHPLGIEWGHPQKLLGARELFAQVFGPVDAEALSPLFQHRIGGTEAGARVDHGGAADSACHRYWDRRPAFGDRQAAIAVEAGDRVQRFLRVALAVEVLAGLEHDHVEPGLGEGRRGDGAAGAGADDHNVAFLSVPRRLGLAQRAGGLGHAIRRRVGSWR